MEQLDSLKIQSEIRFKSEETRNALQELHKWEQQIKSADKKKDIEDGKNNATAETPPPPRVQLLDELKKSANSEKEKGNAAVKKNNYKEALEFYTKAIELYNSDPVFYSNRSLCYLKMDKFQECVADSTKAIELDNNQNSTVAHKAIYRRMKAYESLEKFPQALHDCQSLIKQDKKQEEMYKKTYEDLKKKYETKLRRTSDYEKIDFITKPPNLRSKKPLKRVEISEIEDIVSKQVTNKTKVGNQTLTAPQINSYDADIPDEIVDKIFDNATGEASSMSPRSLGYFGCKSPKSPIISPPVVQKAAVDNKIGENLAADKVKLKNKLNSQSSVISQNNVEEDDEKVDESSIPDVPKSGSQFHVIWRELPNVRRYLFLKKIASSNINPVQLTKMFDSILESDLLTEILYVLKQYFIVKNDSVKSILLPLANCNELCILSLLMSAQDREALKELLNYMQIKGKDTNDEIELVKAKFSIE